MPFSSCDSITLAASVYIYVYIYMVRVFVMNSYHQSQYLKTSDSKCLALIAQMVRAFCMNPKVGGWSPPQVETFSVSKSLTLSQEDPFENECRYPHTIDFSNAYFISYIYIYYHHIFQLV